MKWTRFLLSVALLPFFQGCLEVETIATRIVLPADGGPATVIIEYVNISSGEADTVDVKKDFNQLLNDWKGDQYLLDHVESPGMYIKKRDVFIRDGRIVGHVAGLMKMKDLGQLYTFWVSHGERIMMFDPTDSNFELVETNGEILKTRKNTLIVWPEEATELYWTQRQSDLPGSFEKNRPLMVRWLKEYLATEGSSPSIP